MSHTQIKEPSILFELGMSNFFMDDIVAEENEVKKWKMRIKENKNDAESSGSKKSMHREIEKQRRKDMAALYASLRSLLPLQYVKGRRAVCDHMEQAVNYIKDMQNKIEETKIRRNKLKKFDAQSSSINYEVNLLRDDGMEILITTYLCFPLSKVLAYLLEVGLIVTTYVSTTCDHCSFHKLQIQNEIKSIDIPELKERLANLIN